MGQSADQLRREIESTRSDLGETLDAIGDRLSPGRMMERRKNRVVGSLQSVRERVMGSASDAGSTVSQAMTGTASSAVDTIKDAPETLRQHAQGNPLAAGAIAVGVGVLLASIFPATEQEQRAAGQLMDKAEPLKDELRQAGQEVAEHIKEPAREAVEEVKDAAAEGAQAISLTAQEAAHTTSDTAREASDNIRDEVSDEGSAQRLT